MILKILGSSSKGNCYILESSSGERLMIDMGFKGTELKKFIRFDSKRISAVLTHYDSDHCKGINDLLKMGIQVYGSKETFERLEIDHLHNVNTVKPFTKYKIGKEFAIVPFDVNHDVPCFGYIIEHEECGKVFFATDTYFIDYTFGNLNNIIIEANYSEEIIERKYGEDSDKAFLRDRVLQSHFSLENCISFLSANDLSKVNNIVLIHLSDSNSDEEMFRQRVEDKTGKTVYVADSNMEIEFNKITNDEKERQP